MIVTSDAIVLRTRKQGETSKIATLYTRNFGKLNVIAKGAREMKSKFGGTLEMGALISAIFYKKEKSEPGLYLLSKADLIASNAGILNSLERIGSAMAIAELLLRSMHDEDAHPAIFELVSDTFHTLSGTQGGLGAAPVEYRFYFEFARLMGFEITSEVRTEASRTLREALILLQGCTMDEAAAHLLEDPVRQQLQSFFYGYFSKHISGLSGRSMKSSSVFEQL